MVTYMDIRYTLFYLLSHYPEDIRKRKLKELKEDNPKEHNEFFEWYKETIQMGEEDLGQKFDD